VAWGTDATWLILVGRGLEVSEDMVIQRASTMEGNVNIEPRLRWRAHEGPEEVRWC